MYRILLFVLLATSLFAREYIAIVDFEGIDVSENQARALTQRLTSEMIALEVYQVLERSEMKRLLDEQKFQYSGCVDMKCAVEIGKMIGAKYMVVGSISNIGSTYSIDARLINVETSESYVSAKYDSSDEIDMLLKKGMVSIAHQLSEIPIESDIIEISVDNDVQKEPLIVKTPTTDFIAYKALTNDFIAYKDDVIPTKKSSLVLNDYYYKGHELELSDNTTIYGNYLGTNSGLVLFAHAGYVKNIHCNRVVNIYDGVGDKIDYDCTEDTFFPEQ